MPAWATPLLFIGPTFLLLGLLVVFPLAFSLWHSFQQWDLQLGPQPMGFVGFRNYVQIVENPLFWDAIRFTVWFALVAVFLELVLGVMIALLLDQRLPGVMAVRALIILPTAVSPIIAGLMFRYLLYPGTGLIAYILQLLGMNVPATGVLGSSHWAPFGIGLTTIWEWTPFVALVVLAGIQSIPTEMVEAARVDGAGSVRLFLKIILPNLRFVLSIAVLIRLMQTFNIFSPIYAETHGGPGIATTSASYLLYQNGLLYYNLGMTFAMQWVIVACVLTIVNAAVWLAFRGIEL